MIAKGLVDPNVPKSAKTSNLLLWGSKPGTPGYNPPTFAEMMRLATVVLQRRADLAKKPFMLVAEPESTDNFGNECNAIGTLCALKRADDGIGVARKFLAAHPKTMILTAADSDANGLQLMPDVRDKDGNLRMLGNTKLNSADGKATEVPYDGLYGRNTVAFEAAPDQFGVRMPFAIAWAAGGDVQGGILARAAGLNADLLQTRLSARFDNIDVYRMLHATLTGKWLPYPEAKRPTER
jgi:alkaline phosphatase